VLTEPAEFSGELAHLVEAAAAAAPVPVMRKDFLVLPYQLFEARVSGAAGVLLIAAMLDDAALREMLDLALELGLFVLVEVFDRADLDRALAALATAGPALDPGRCRWLIGVNCRDLRTLAVDFGRFAELAPVLPQHVPLVAESGVQTEEEAAQVAALGYRLALVGTALMRATDPAAKLAGLLAAGRGRSRACASS
jgi:indole-3-glycerol phosphate synthase